MSKKVIAAVALAAVLALGLCACGSSQASSSASASASNASSAASSSTASGVVEIDGVVVKEIGVDMVGETPNLMVIFSNPTDKDVEVDCAQFEVKKADGTVVDFGKSKKTISANQSYTQWAFTAKSGTLQKGDKVSISFDGKPLGEYEVTEF